MNKQSKTLLNAARSNLVRIVVHLKDGRLSTGTGFFVSDRVILTCTHIFFDCGSLYDLQRTLQKNKKVSDELSSKFFSDYLKKIVKKIEVELSDGSRHTIRKMHYDTSYDVAGLELVSPYKKRTPVPVTTKHTSEYGEEVWCLGFPDTFGVLSERSPFTFQTARIRSFANLRLTGIIKHPYVSLDALCPPGMSGGPVIDPVSGAIVAQINGYNSWGNDNVAFQKIIDGKKEFYGDSFYTPLPITFSTTFGLLQKKVPFLKAWLS